MALDESTENDEVIENGGFTFLIEKKLLQEAKPITVDYVISPGGEGFVISSGMKKDSDCGGGCSSC
jgi:Fe-S cluster assembly iron-binding protein IscA